VLFAASPPEEPETRAEARRKVLLFDNRLGLGGGRARAPEIDVELLDLLDQQLNRAAGCAQLLARVVGEPFAPTAEQIDFLFVEPLHRTTPAVDDRWLSTGSTVSSTETRTGFVRSDAKDEPNR
jgi:hypothetical protein